MEFVIEIDQLYNCIANPEIRTVLSQYNIVVMLGLPCPLSVKNFSLLNIEKEICSTMGSFQWEGMGSIIIGHILTTALARGRVS